MPSPDDIPGRLPEIELSDHDVRTDAAMLLADMQALREEGLADRTLDDKKLDEYLHLSHRLAGIIKSYADGRLTAKAVVVGEALAREPRLLQYDPGQDGHWDVRQPHFTRALDDILMALTREQFDNPVKRHHVLQALKFVALSSQELTPKEREEAYLTIRPFHGGIPPEQSGLARLIGRLIGTRYSIDLPKDTPLDARVNGPAESLPAVLDELRRRGYATVIATLPRQDLDGLKIDGATPIGDAYRSCKPQFLGRIAGTLVKYTRPLSSIILGSLPATVQHYLQERLGSGNYTPESAYCWSAWTEALASIGSGITLGAATGNWWYAIVGIPGTVEAIARASIRDSTEDVAGTLAGKLACLPFEKGLAEQLRREQSLISVRIPLRERTTPPDAAASRLTALATRQVPEDAEQNLAWNPYDPVNTHQYGKRFIEALAGAPAPFETVTARAAQYAALGTAGKAGRYTKRVALACQPGVRYLVTVIGERTEPLLLDVIAREATMKPPAEAAAALSKAAQAAYVHIARYERGTLVQEADAIR
jgi:hypothetical protein